jgi:hypothetical protein
MELLATTAISAELHRESAVAATQALEHTQETTARINAQRAIDLYRAETGTNPPSLQALVPNFLAEVPYGLNYDPQVGMIVDYPVQQPHQPGANQPRGLSNEQRIQEIHEAINNYGTAVGYYPPTLHAMVPTYIDAVPTTADGRQFLYNNQNGALMHPDQLAGTYTPDRAGSTQTVQQRPQGQRRAVGGGGLLGETITGIGIQQDLNAMPNAAGGSVGQRTTGKARNIGQQQTDKHNAVMNDLGL